MPQAPLVPCPRCRNLASFDKQLNPSRPFCSERCKDIDFGAWATEQYAVAQAPDSSNAALDDLEEADAMAALTARGGPPYPPPYN